MATTAWPTVTPATYMASSARRHAVPNAAAASPATPSKSPARAAAARVTTSAAPRTRWQSHASSAAGPDVWAARPGRSSAPTPTTLAASMAAPGARRIADRLPLVEQAAEPGAHPLPRLDQGSLGDGPGRLGPGRGRRQAELLAGVPGPGWHERRGDGRDGGEQLRVGGEAGVVAEIG